MRRGCWAEEEPKFMFCVSMKLLTTFRYSYLGSFFLDPKILSLGEIWNFIIGTELPWLGHQIKGQKGSAKKGLHASGP